MYVHVYAHTVLIMIIITNFVACISTQCPRGSVCRVCNRTRRAYCEYTCARDNGGCDTGSQCIEVYVPTCSPGQCCSPVNITCQSMLIIG